MGKELVPGDGPNSGMPAPEIIRELADADKNNMGLNS